MNRRRFLTLLGAAAGAAALDQAIPFGRVWSFPSNIVIPKEKNVERAIWAMFEVGDIVQFHGDQNLYCITEISVNRVGGWSIETYPKRWRK